MPSPRPIALAAVRGSRSIRVGIVLLAAFGFALSYDALRQMAVAGHVRGPLTYLFPLVIDGFIAIGIVALLILRGAPLHSRLYVWTLIGAATGTSIAANVVHAIGLNEGTRLHLNNTTAGALSAIAPLALAGAVHLYLVMNRHLADDDAVAEARPATEPAVSAKPEGDRQICQELASDANTVAPAKTSSPPPTPEAKSDAIKIPSAKKASKSRQRTVPEEKLLATARAIGAENGQVPRTALEKAVRAKGYTVSKDDAKKAADAVREELTATKSSVVT
ncbi:DUF2637 domain-containing protein [Streptomyces sp. NEAU-Y11]|uniref:DUF2637 domain-containing protein n=1 Tax=Streptomyces cucumeris TaxID=2962890 RepID=UPI0020C86E5D|nr:DUF2637 domain-containing protein [Streptomyces sp. NEAU-Y11]MCP9207154.1 DUF2637 domain-containing protein [Streptomyces sp. NEAU-Y11]